MNDETKLEALAEKRDAAKAEWHNALGRIVELLDTDAPRTRIAFAQGKADRLHDDYRAAVTAWLNEWHRVGCPLDGVRDDGTRMTEVQ